MIAAIDKGRKVCVSCGQEKDISQFYRLGRRNGREFTPRCKPCASLYAGETNQRVREAVIGHYSDWSYDCALCSEDRIACLDIDHIENDGAKDRKTSKNSYTLFRRLIKTGFPAGFQVLCKNCNWVKHVDNQKERVRGKI